jgi:hypothetical protein
LREKKAAGIPQLDDVSRQRFGFDRQRQGAACITEQARGQTMKVLTAREVLNVSHTIGPITATPRVSFGRSSGRERDDSLEGILIFSGIGLALTILAAVFQWLELPPPYF